jgi:hypothetical protein
MEGRMGRGGLMDMVVDHMHRLVRLVGAVVEGVGEELDAAHEGLHQEAGQEADDDGGEREERGGELE